MFLGNFDIIWRKKLRRWKAKWIYFNIKHLTSGRAKIFTQGFYILRIKSALKLFQERERSWIILWGLPKERLYNFLPVMIADSNICVQLTTDFPFTNLPYNSFLVMLTVSLKQKEADLYTHPPPTQTHTCIYMCLPVLSLIHIHHCKYKFSQGSP